MLHRLRIGPLPEWLDAPRLLGDGFTPQEAERGWVLWIASLSPVAAADVAARLRGLGFGGRPVEVEVQPRLERRRVRAARAVDARRRREASVGFSRAGVQLDPEARMSLTPEALALELGERAAGRTVVDACAGAGGNAIGFARAGCRVLAIEHDASRIAMAQHNAGIYGVADRIEWRSGDAVPLLTGLEADLLFIDPPWGEHWSRKRVTLAELGPLPQILPSAQRFGEVWIKVPPSFDVQCVAGARARAVFGVGPGDAQRVKFVLLELASSRA